MKRSMRFSIQGLLVFTTVTALASLLCERVVSYQQDVDRIRELEAAMESLNARLAIKNATQNQVLQSTRDENKLVQRARDRAVLHFDVLYDKYGQIVDRGKDVTSLRLMPTLSHDATPVPVLFKIRVPEGRDVWLKFGVRAHDESIFTSTRIQGLLRASPFTSNGPYEKQLPTGEVIVCLSAGIVRDSELPLRLTLDGETLVETVYRSERVRHAGFSYLSAPNQYDVAAFRSLPHLVQARMNYRLREADHVVDVWLDDASSGLRQFPMR